MLKSPLLPLLLLLLLMPLSVAALDSPQTLQLADSPAQEGDPYRAITEYQRFIFVQPTLLGGRVRIQLGKGIIG